MAKEKRAHARVAVPINARLLTGSQETELPVRDVSVGGIYLYTRRPPGGLGTPVRLKLALNAGIKPIVVSGKIVHLEPDPMGDKGDVLGIGVQFDPGGPEQDKALVALLDKAMLGRGTNNRAYPRVAYLLEVTCRSKQELRAVMRDVGEGGMGLTIERGFGKDDEVTVEVGYGGGLPVKLPGWVVSCEPLIRQPGSFRVGVRFGKLSPPVRAQLLKILEALYRR